MLSIQDTVAPVSEDLH